MNTTMYLVGSWGGCVPVMKKAIGQQTVYLVHHGDMVGGAHLSLQRERERE